MWLPIKRCSACCSLLPNNMPKTVLFSFVALHLLNPCVSNFLVLNWTLAFIVSYLFYMLDLLFLRFPIHSIIFIFNEKKRENALHWNMYVHVQCFGTHSKGQLVAIMFTIRVIGHFALNFGWLSWIIYPTILSHINGIS